METPAEIVWSLSARAMERRRWLARMRRKVMGRGSQSVLRRLRDARRRPDAPGMIYCPRDRHEWKRANIVGGDGLACSECRAEGQAKRARRARR